MKYFLSRSGIYLITILLAICFFKVNGFFSNKKSEIIRGDGFGYYSYLPALFIYGDYSQGFVPANFKKHYVNNGLPEYIEIINNKPVDKYFFGTAVLMYPFFMTAHLLSYYFHQPHDGYSMFYQYLIGLSAVFYVFVGIYFCRKLLLLYGATALEAVLICALIVFATNLYLFAVVDPYMSHSFSFAVVSGFLFFSKAISELKTSKYIIPAFICLGLVILIRPINVLIILALPFLIGSFSKLQENIKFILHHYLLTLLGVLSAFIIVSFQFLIWYKETGHFIVYSYTYERFYFDKPNIINVLFSYRKGLFVYAPLLFLSLTGLIFLFQRKIFSAFSFLGFFLLIIYIFSCWHDWSYGASFGFRPMIEYYSLFAIMLLFALNTFKKRIGKIIFVLLCFCTLFVNQIQAYQYRKFILHWYNMSSYKYWRIFLKTDQKWNGYVWDNPEPSDLPGTIVSTFSTDFENPGRDWNGISVLNVGVKAHSGTMVTAVDSTNIYSNTLILSSNSKILKCAKPAYYATGYIHFNNNSSSDKLNLVINYQKDDGREYYYRSRLVDNLTRDVNGWKRFDIALMIEKPESESDKIKIYFWNPEMKSFWIDDVTFKFIDVK
jgi:hypothetical protein